MFRLKLNSLIPRFSKKDFLKENIASDVDSTAYGQNSATYRPERLDLLCSATKFSRRELQIIYRGFKQECPFGIVDVDTFRSIYSQFFPQGNTASYAKYIFNAFDVCKKGVINFEEYVMSLSRLSRGTVEDKLNWIFRLYDINGDGVISEDEIVEIMFSVFDMTDKFRLYAYDEKMILEHARLTFQKMDPDPCGFVSKENFMKTYIEDEEIIRTLSIFDTVV